MSNLASRLIALRMQRASAAARVRNPRTDPRLAIEAEDEVRSLDIQIADLAEKIETAAGVIEFPPVCQDCKGTGIIKAIAADMLIELNCRCRSTLKTGN